MKNLSCFLVLILISFSSCESDPGMNSGKFGLGDTVSIKVREVLKNEANKISVQLDSVLNDSRCAIDVVCVWAGNAEVRFIFKSADDEIKFILNTTVNPKDTVINGYKISLVNLLPAPVSTHPIPYNEYNATVTIQKN